MSILGGNQLCIGTDPLVRGAVLWELLPGQLGRGDTGLDCT